MRIVPLLAIGLALGPVVVAVAVAAPAKTGPASLLSPADLDPQAVLPRPPVADSAQALAEVAELHAMEQRRTPAEIAAAKIDGDSKSAAIFGEVLGPKFDLATLPATAKLFDLVRASEKAVVDRGKDEFKRQRPWIVDPSLQSCARSDKPLSSYPSGHTAMAFSMAAVLVRLIPGRADAIMARAARYGESRIVCEQHFRSDVTAGEALGLLIGERLIAKRAFATAFAASKAELIKAGIASR